MKTKATRRKNQGQSTREEGREEKGEKEEKGKKRKKEKREKRKEKRREGGRAIVLCDPIASPLPPLFFSSSPLGGRLARAQPKGEKEKKRGGRGGGMHGGAGGIGGRKAQKRKRL